MPSFSRFIPPAPPAVIRRPCAPRPGHQPFSLPGCPATCHMYPRRCGRVRVRDGGGAATGSSLAADTPSDHALCQWPRSSWLTP